MRTKNRTKGQGQSQRKRKNKTRKMKGGNNPFSDVFGMWGTMTYNLSNALSVFSIDAPTAHMNQPKLVDPNPGKQFLNQ
jgi:hypothetical protein